MFRDTGTKQMVFDQVAVANGGFYSFEGACGILFCWSPSG